MTRGSSRRVGAYPAGPHFSVGWVGQNHVEPLQRIFPGVASEVSLNKPDIVEAVQAGALPCLPEQLGLNLYSQHTAIGVLLCEEEAHQTVPATEIRNSPLGGRLDEMSEEKTVNGGFDAGRGLHKFEVIYVVDSVIHNVESRIQNSGEAKRFYSGSWLLDSGS